MTQPGDSDEWWKQYGGEGGASDTPSAAPQQATPPPLRYPPAPNPPQSPLTPPPQPQYPNYSPPQPNPAAGYPQPGPGGYSPAAPGGYPQPGQAPGQPAYGYQPYGYQQPSSTNGLATAALIVSIVGVPLAFLCFLLPIAPLIGLILGVVALNQVKNSGQQGRGLALGGIWIGAAGIAISILFLALFIGGIVSSPST
ncbi:MAG: hypothetical protein JWN03_795 [Nocardia sp.]|uniref:DUF4190 domain-containing protein n=1 Tax=Nocardia sp. TaxID=1821 RepID=UPI00261EB49E|nr:DUF4190 domain-containing protein [Nocardia sp.]MCU1640520.1 hypothetical protein [Nocardia sp.]